MPTLQISQSATVGSLVNFQRYYEEAGPDYAAWSPDFNMHFGFFRKGMNPLRREAMLEQMNQEIQHRLHLTDESRHESSTWDAASEPHCAASPGVFPLPT